MRLPDSRGISLIEATIVLTVLSILTAAAAPSVSRTIDRARLTRATDDMKAIRTALITYVTDSAFDYFTHNGSNTGGGGDIIEMLVSDGDIPGNSGATNWDDVTINFGAAVDVDFLEKHLVTNVLTGGAPNAYAVWRGAYLSGPVDPDPWGNRYAVNVQYMNPVSANDVFVLSAGPDEQIDTAYTINGAVPGDDDRIVVVYRDSNPALLQ
jgi:type II secretory pathway pseudopilin PulG